MVTPLTDKVRQICDDALAAMEPGASHSLVGTVRAKLQLPLQVTVAGSVSSGKSTLVNALLGQRIAAVDAGECTRVVTTFRYDHHERAEARLSNGETVRVPLDKGRLPSSLGAPIEMVDELVVYLSNANLRDLSIVDTPGLNTVTEVNEEATSAFLGVDRSSTSANTSAIALAQADALIFLMPHLRQADADVLRGFRDLFTGSGLSAVNAVGVLSKVDRLTRDGDPLVAAEPIARRVANDLRGLVCDVQPLVGLLAETAHAALFTEEDARSVAIVAAVDDPFDREDLLLSPEDFLQSDAFELPMVIRRRLLDLLDMYGLRVALAAHDSGARGASALLRAFADHSGLGPIRETVLDRFARQAQLLKAHTAVCELMRISYLRDDATNAKALRSLRTPLERLELDRDMQRLRVFDVMHAVSVGEQRLPDELLADLERLCASDDPLAQLGLSDAGAWVQAAIDGAGRWGRYGADPRRGPADARRARVVKQAYELLVAQATSEGVDR